MEDLALLERLRTTAARVLPGHSILAAYAFGSRVSGRAGPESDLDVGYYLEGYQAGATLRVAEEMTLAADLEDEVGVRIDLRDLGDAPLELRGRVLEDGVRIYSGDPARRVALERALLSRYHDYKHEYRLMHEARLRRVAARGV